MKPSLETFSQTLMIESSSFVDADPENARKYFERKYPEFELIKISCSMDTKDLQGLFTALEFIENVCNVLENSMEEDDDDPSCSNRRSDLEFYKEQKKKLFDQIENERKEASKNPPCVFFLTFLTHFQASQVFNQERKKSKFCSMKDNLRFSPLPQKLRHGRSTCVAKVHKRYSSLLVPSPQILEEC